MSKSDRTVRIGRTFGGALKRGGGVSRNANLPDGTSWPAVGLDQLERTLRYGDEESVMVYRHAAASVVAAYRALCFTTTLDQYRKVRTVVRAENAADCLKGKDDRLRAELAKRGQQGEKQ